MAIVFEWTEEQVKTWAKWLASRPPVIRALAERFPVNRLYLLKTTGQRVMPLSYFENGTLKVLVSGQFNVVFFDRAVFGISPDDLEECDLPEPGDSLRSLFE